MKQKNIFKKVLVAGALAVAATVISAMSVLAADVTYTFENSSLPDGVTTSNGASESFKSNTLNDGATYTAFKLSSTSNLTKGLTFTPSEDCNASIVVGKAGGNDKPVFKVTDGTNIIVSESFDGISDKTTSKTVTFNAKRGTPYYLITTTKSTFVYSIALFSSIPSVTFESVGDSEACAFTGTFDNFDTDKYTIKSIKVYDKDISTIGRSADGVYFYTVKFSNMPTEEKTEMEINKFEIEDITTSSIKGFETSFSLTEDGITSLPF